MHGCRDLLSWLDRHQHAHLCLPCPSRCVTPEQKIMVDGKDVVPDVWEVLDKIKRFTDKVRLPGWIVCV